MQLGATGLDKTFLLSVKVGAFKVDLAGVRAALKVVEGCQGRA